MLFRRQPEVPSFSAIDPEHVVTLNALNMAKEDILGTRRWEFDLRHDGQLITKATTSSQSIAFSLSGTTGSAQATLYNSDANTAYDTTPELIAQLAGNWVLRVIPTGDADYSNTAMRANSCTAVSAGLAYINLPFSLPKDLYLVDCDVIYSEYLLPDTVREVVRASIEQTPLSLEQIDPTVRFDELFPASASEQGAPRSFNVGGFDIGTYDSTGSVPDPKLRAIVWPVPDDEYIISYSYYYKHADLTTGTDTWDGIPSDIINDIVWQATSIVKMAIDGDYAASHFADMAQAQASTKHMAYGGSSARRHVVGSWDTGGSFGASPEGFPGKLIG